MNGCLREPALWPVADGEPVAPDVAMHLRTCARCTAQVALLRDHKRQLRAATGGQPPPIVDATGRQFGNSGAAGDDRHDPPELRRAAADRSRAGPRPTTIGRYVVERLLTLGGQAEVYLAGHPSLRDRVVVKWAYASVTDAPAVADQFTEEARLLAAVRHPHLPRVYDLGLAANRPFLVLEHIPGGTLATRRDRPLTCGEAAAVIAKVARALHAVHDFGRLHLDIQPDNILLGHDGEPRLIDFGMSRTRDDTARHSAGTTAQGTPEYMAPEQLTGDWGRIGVATDIYALGAVLHELLTGAAPLPELIWENDASCGQKKPVWTRASRVERICRRALHPDPQRRYRSAREFANELERIAAGPRSSWLMVAGLIIAAGAAVCSAQQVRPVETARAELLRKHPPASPMQRRELIAAAIHRLLDDPETRNWTPSIILADGRTVPIAAKPGAASLSTQEFANIIAAQVDAQPATTLLVVAPDPAQVRGPPLPAGTIAQVSEAGVTVLEPRTAAGPAVVRALCGLQRRLGEWNPQYRALVLASPPNASVPTGSNSSGSRLSIPRHDTVRASGVSHEDDDDCPEWTPAPVVVRTRRTGRTGPL